jgi:hypothetical protein
MVDAVAMSVDITGVFGQGQPVAPSFNKFIGFGDSNIDSGYFFTHDISTNATLEAQYEASVAAGGGIPTSLGGKMNSVLLAADYGLTAIPVGEPGGTNYAASGALANDTRMVTHFNSPRWSSRVNGDQTREPVAGNLPLRGASSASAVAVGAQLGWGWHSARGCKDEISGAHRIQPQVFTRIDAPYRGPTGPRSGEQHHDRRRRPTPSCRNFPR